MSSGPEKNFGLTEVTFNEMVADLKRSDTSFFETVFLTHFNEACRYLKNHCGASDDNAYDAVMDTMLLFRKRFVEGKLAYGNLRFLFTKMASQIYFKKNKKDPLFDQIDFEIAEDLPRSNEEELKTLNIAWSSLSDSCKQLLKSFYFAKMPLHEYATMENKSYAAIRKQKERCLERLKGNFKLIP